MFSCELAYESREVGTFLKMWKLKRLGLRFESLSCLLPFPVSFCCCSFEAGNDPEDPWPWDVVVAQVNSTVRVISEAANPSPAQVIITRFDMVFQLAALNPITPFLGRGEGLPFNTPCSDSKVGSRGPQQVTVEGRGRSIRFPEGGVVVRGCWVC